MTKIFPTALLAATAFGSLVLLPAGPAQAAQSPACGAAVDAINAAIDAAGGNLTPTVAQSLAAKLTAIDAAGTDKTAIDAYAHALVDDNITNMTGATEEFNRVCAG